MKNIFTIWAQTPDFPVCAVLLRVRTLVLFLGMIAFSFTPSAEAQSYVFSKFEVSGNQRIDAAFSQVFHRLPAFVLAHISVQCATLEILSSKYLGELLRPSFCSCEH